MLREFASVLLVLDFLKKNPIVTIPQVALLQLFNRFGPRSSADAIAEVDICLRAHLV